ncbi:MAG: hypothetical protein MUF21_14605 [Gemmatimonadaceae bacterium]|nr:hypothetical protein [Gemmatimonadaceae bacterium]
MIVYRDRSGDEIRDIAVVRQVDGAWRAPVRVHPDGWRITGCPVNGPAVVARGDTVAVAWFTRAGDTARVLVAVSTDAGAMFDAPVRIDDGVPLGRVAIALDPESRPIVAWLEQVAPSRAQLRVRRVTLDGRRSAATTVASVEAARASGVPQMVALRDSLLLAWTSPVPVPKIRVAAVPFR